MMTPEQAFEKTRQKWRDIADGECGDEYQSHAQICGFCKFDDETGLPDCKGCPALRHFGVEDCLEEIPAVAEVCEYKAGSDDYYAAAANVVKLLEENRDGLIAAGHAILKEIEDA